MKTVIALLAVLAVAAVSVSVKADDQTYVSNQSTIPIRATTVYDFAGSSDFQNRLIDPGTDQSDIYSAANCNGAGEPNPVGVILGLDGSRQQQQTVWVSCDHSLVGENNPDGLSVDIYDSVYGYIDEPTGSVLASLSP